MRILQKASRFLFKALEWFAIICMVVLTVIVVQMISYQR